MNAEFNWWLLIVGLVVGAGLVWLVIADWSRREEDLTEDERSAESSWIAETLRERGENVDPAAAEEILALHRLYLRQSSGLEDTRDGFDEADADDEFDDAPIDDERASAAGARGTSATPQDRAAGDTEESAATATELPAHRASVRDTPLSPRGSAADLEADRPQL